MMKYNELVILTILVVILSILIFYYYINACNTSIEFFNEDKNKIKHEKIGKKVLEAKRSIIFAVESVASALNYSVKAVDEVKKR